MEQKILCLMQLLPAEPLQLRFEREQELPPGPRPVSATGLWMAETRTVQFLLGRQAA
ncbi:MAG TPA: hypothetical protein VFP71_09630 [Candidatus Angelobacter sp.]|nr:hypothetical protein [Candidatus Angelobacter sp.]